MSNGHAVKDRPHGTWRRYQYEDCQCDRCTRAWSVYVQLRKGDQVHGRQRLVGAGPAVRHVKMMMRKWGVGASRVWMAADMSHSQGWNLMRGVNRKMDRDARNRILAVTIDQVDPQAWMDADHVRGEIATIRKKSPGLTLRDLERRTGLAKDALRGAASRGKAKVRVGTYRQVREYRRLGVRNLVCEDCRRPALGGGRWCLDHFKENADARDPSPKVHRTQTSGRRGHVDRRMADARGRRGRRPREDRRLDGRDHPLDLPRAGKRRPRG